MKLASAHLFLVCLCAMAVSCSAEDAFDMESARKVFENRCSACHGLDRPLKKNKDREGWKKTVERMKSYSPERISQSDAVTILEYLNRVRGPTP